MLNQKLVDFIHAAPWIVLGTRDEKLRSHGSYAMGARVDGATGVLTVFVPDAMGDRVLPAVRASRLAAVVLGEPSSHETYQLKGDVTEVRPMTAADDAVQDIFMAKMGGVMAQLGFPVADWKFPPPHPGTAVVIQVRDVYVQTPGPGAGARIGP